MPPLHPMILRFPSPCRRPRMAAGSGSFRARRPTAARAARVGCTCKKPLACLLAAAASACAPKVVIGERFCAQPPGDAAVNPDPDATVATSWSTGFEDGFCEYALPTGFCFATGFASYALVQSPVHSGRYAAAFFVNAAFDGGSQARCVQQGVFPQAAYYGAWYYVPSSAVNSGDWNLLHFQGGDAGQTLHYLWDVSLVSLADGGLHISLYDFLNQTTPDAGAVPPIPLDQWFHIEVYFKRAKDTTGEISMWQDGVAAVHLTGLETDDSVWGQWYVGNLANALLPTASTVYVDDVTIGPTLSASPGSGE